MDKHWWRRLALLILAAGAAAGIAAWAPPCQAADKAVQGPGFSFKTVEDKASALAAKPYQPPQKLPDFLTNLSYDEWRDIRFKPAMSLWWGQNLPFIVQFFHPGLYYDRLVAINVVEDGKASSLRYSPDQFTFGRNDFKDKLPADFGYAGFRIHYPINTKTYMDEVAVFLGATYIRAVGKAMNYGMSTRGAAINTALPEGEEFPWFREFWIVKPSPGAAEITVYALMDSPSLAGAYRFLVHPGKETVIDTDVMLFWRKVPSLVGLAPLTSMFFYGENTNKRPVDDFRPEIHDSDGFMLATGKGEWLWRPLMNPPSLLVNSFQTTNPQGFGLIQRDIDFESYQDLEAHYEVRPSVWVTPKGEWGEGRVQLIQIPTDTEFNDNVTVFWVPGKPIEQQKPLTYSYSMNWHMPHAGLPPAGRVAATRTARGKNDQARLFIIDFAGGKLGSLPANTALTAVVTVGEHARLLEQQLQRNKHINGWRLSFQVQSDEPGPLEKVLPNKRPPPIELRAFLKDGDNIMTETWSYAYPP